MHDSGFFFLLITVLQLYEGHLENHFDMPTCIREKYHLNIHFIVLKKCILITNSIIRSSVLKPFQMPNTSKRLPVKLRPKMVCFCGEHDLL